MKFHTDELKSFELKSQEYDKAIEEQQSVISNAKKTISELKEQRQDLALETMIKSMRLYPNKIFDIAWKFYWIYQEVSVPTINNALMAVLSQTKAKEAMKLVKDTAQATDTCHQCGKEVPIKLTSRNDQKLKQSIPHNSICKDCQEKNTQKTKEYWAARDARLLELKTMPYKEYLQTDEWKETRMKALKRAGFKCQVCNKEGKLNVHHRTYENRGNEQNKDLTVLCEDCHHLYHFGKELQ